MQVPRTLVPEVSLDNLPNVKAGFTPVENTAAQGLIHVGQGLKAAGRDFASLAEKMHDEISQSLVGDAMNRAYERQDILTNDKDGGYRTLQGRNALERPDGQSLTEEYMGRFDADLQEISGSLKTEAQKEMFRKNSEVLRRQMMTGTREHALRQNALFQDSVDEGRIATGIRMLAQGSDAAAWEEGIAYARNGAFAKYARMGISGEAAEELFRKEAGGGILAVIAQKTDAGDFAGAQGVYDAYGRYMTATDINRARDLITKTAEADSDAALGRQLAQLYEDGGVGELTLNEQKFGADSGGDVYGSFADRIISPKSPEYTGRGRKDNPRSTAFGWGQFINSTLLHYIKQEMPELARGKSNAELLKYRDDPKVMRQLTAAYARDNGTKLARAGLPVNHATLYLSHFLDAPVAIRVLKADPNTPIAAIVGDKVMKANPHLNGKTAGQTAAWAEKAIGGKGGAGGISTVQKKVQVNGFDDIEKIISAMPLPQQQRVRAAMQQEAAALNRAKEAQRTEHMNNAINTLAESGGDMNKVPPSLLNLLEPKDRKQLQDYAASVVSGDESALFLKNRQDYYLYMNSPDVLMSKSREEVEAMKARFGIERTQRLLSVYDSSKEDYQKGRKESSAAKVNASVVANLAQLYGLKTLGKGNEKQTQMYYTFTDNVQKVADEYYHTQGRSPTDAELFEIVSKLVAKKITTEEHWYGDTQEYEMTMSPADRLKYAQSKDKK